MLVSKDNLGDRVNDFVTESGSGIRKRFHGVPNKETGEIELVEDPPQNLYEYIQSFKDSVDINKIVERFQNGEIDILNQVQGIYADVSKAPKDLAASYSAIREAEYQFERLPIDIKAKFENNFDKYIAEFGKDTWLDKMTLKKEEKGEEIKYES